MSMWPRRSSTMRLGGRPSQDLGGPANRMVDRNSRIPLPRSSSHTSVAPKFDLPGTFKRSKSTLGAPYTPQEKGLNAAKITPLVVPSTPKLFGSYSSKKTGHQKDSRNLQDKEFQKEAYHSVLQYFQGVSTMNVTEIRPMNTKLFVDMVNHILAKLEIYNKDELVQFTTQNYVKELPHWAGCLQYPGQISKSGWLVTASAAQCWPQVIGLLSWLVNLVKVTALYDPEARINYEAERDPETYFQVAYLKGCQEAHNRVTAGEDFQDIVLKVVELEEHLNGVTDNELEKIKTENEKLRAKADDPDLKAEQDLLDELEQRLNVAQSQSMKAVDELEAKTESIERAKINVAKKERNIVALRNETELIRQEVKVLQRQVESQSMSITEFAEIKKKCDYLLQEISYTEKECEDNEKLVGRYEHDIAAKRDKILQNASMFNRQVIQLEQQIPELQGLRARTNPESANVVEEVEKLVRALRDLKTRLAAEWTELEVLRREKQQRVDSLKQRLRDAASSEVTVRESVLIKKTEIEQLRTQVIEEEKKLKSEVKDLEKRQMVLQHKQQENDKQIEQIQEMEKKSEFLDKCKAKLIELHEAEWKKLEEVAKHYQAEIRAIKDKIKENEAELEGLIDELVADLDKN